MKAALALLVLAVVGTAVAVGLALGSKDDVPGNVRACVQNGQATVVHGPLNLDAARREIAAGLVHRVRTARRGDDTIVLLAGQRVRLLVIKGRKSPTLAGDLPRRLYRHADAYALVAQEIDPVRGVLADCMARG